MLDSIIQEYREAIFDTDRRKAIQIIDDAYENGLLPEDIVFKIVIPVIETMMKDISEGQDYNLAQHFIAAQIAAQITEKMTPLFRDTSEKIGTVVIGTSVGDLHGLGKKIVVGCLKSFMINIIDLGLNVTPEKFVEKAVEHNAEVIGISSMMLHSARGERSSLGVRKILKERGLESKIKIAVGGAPYRFDHSLYKLVEADGWAGDGMTAGRVITDLIKEVRK